MSSRDSGCLRLYNLINRYKGLISLNLTKDAEKEVLVAFSEVLREICLWIEQLESSSEEDIALELYLSDRCLSGLSENDKYNRCFAGVVADLVFLLTVESQYVQHLAGKVLIAVSEFLALSGSNWDVFLQLLYCCFRLTMLNMLPNCSKLPATRSEDVLFNSEICSDILSPKLKSANWSTIAGILQVLRSILKSLHQDSDEQLIQRYMSSITKWLPDVPWDILDETLGQRIELRKSCSDFLSPINNGEESAKAVFLGKLVRFFCSLVEQCSSLNEHPLLLTIIDLAPKLSSWCLGKSKVGSKINVYQYFRYKLLVLMRRLSFNTFFPRSSTVLWLQLLQCYYWDLLQQLLSMPESSQDNCLQGSPFLLASPGQEICTFQSHHLQRQVIFLFLQCCFSLIGLSGQGKDQPTCTASATLLATDSKLDLDSCSKEKGLLALHQWLKGHIPVDELVYIQLYQEKCTNFTLSFLQLYMHEDDLLFKVLLQLHRIPHCRAQGEKREFQDLEEEILFHLSNLFNPVHIFHLFLAELHYDHQVLLDYLISKDSGVNCAEYLLKCLRTVFNTWDIFVKFSVYQELTDELSHKKRKVQLDRSNLHDEISSSSPGIDRSRSLENPIRSQISDMLHYELRCIRYLNAKKCLSSLKLSVESLRQKNLFPYNPKALLKRYFQLAFFTAYYGQLLHPACNCRFFQKSFSEIGL